VDALSVILILLVVAHHSVESYVTTHPPETALPDPPFARRSVLVGGMRPSSWASSPSLPAFRVGLISPTSPPRMTMAEITPPKIALLSAPVQPDSGDSSATLLRTVAFVH
jgi:hypothetical protein